MVNNSTTFEEFVADACNALSISPTRKTFHYNNKNDHTRLIRLHDDRGLSLMCRFNNDMIDIYVTNETNISLPQSISTRYAILVL